MQASEQSRFDALYAKHDTALKLQDKADKTIDSYAQRLHQPIPDSHKMSGRINWLTYAVWLNGTTLEWITSVPRKEVHVQMRQGVAVNLVVEFDSARYGRQSSGDAMCVSHERFCLSGAEVVEFNGMRARYETHISRHRCTLRHGEPGCVERRDDVEGMVSHANRASGAVT